VRNNILHHAQPLRSARTTGENMRIDTDLDAYTQLWGSIGTHVLPERPAAPSAAAATKMRVVLPVARFDTITSRNRERGTSVVEVVRRCHGNR
jgi:hypothetical protein